VRPRRGCRHLKPTPSEDSSSPSKDGHSHIKSCQERKAKLVSLLLTLLSTKAERPTGGRCSSQLLWPTCVWARHTDGRQSPGHWPGNTALWRPALGTGPFPAPHTQCQSWLLLVDFQRPLFKWSMKVGTRATMMLGGALFGTAFAVSGAGVAMHSLPLLYAVIVQKGPKRQRRGRNKKKNSQQQQNQGDKMPQVTVKVEKEEAPVCPWGYSTCTCTSR